MEMSIATTGVQTEVRATVGICLVAVVTGFLTLNVAVPTPCVSAGGCTTVGVDPITVIALLDAYGDNPVATESEAALVRAGIALNFIAIVAFFHAPPDDAVTTAGHQAFAGACIGF